MNVRLIVLCLSLFCGFSLVACGTVTPITTTSSMQPQSGPVGTVVTVFGHGRHTCPAQPFSLSTMTAAATRLFTAFHMEPGWTDHPHPVRNQIGGVARAAGPCPVRYRRR